MTAIECDKLTLEVGWLNKIESGESDVNVVRGLANRVVETEEISPKYAFILGYIAHELVRQTDDANPMITIQLQLF